MAAEGPNKQQLDWPLLNEMDEAKAYALHLTGSMFMRQNVSHWFWLCAIIFLLDVAVTAVGEIETYVF